jgi:hypothetical protein
MDRMAQRMVSIKKYMVHNDDDDVDRIYWALASEIQEMHLHGSEIPKCHAISSTAISVRALPCLGRSMWIQVKQRGQRRATTFRSSIAVR